MKIIFFGSSDFSVPFLNHLYLAGHKIMSVITNADKITGRGKKLIPNPVKIFARKKEIKIIEVLRMDEQIFDKLKTICFDCFVIVSFGHMIPKRFIELSDGNIINVHPSLLPRYRGPSPIMTSLLDGCQKTGISIMKINEYLDEGPLYAQTAFKLSDADNKDSLEEKMIKLGAPLLNSVIELLGKKMIEVYPQEGNPSYSRLFKKDDFFINWSLDSQSIANKIRAFAKEPGALTRFRNKKIKLLNARIENNHSDFLSAKRPVSSFKDGEIIIADKTKGLIVSCGNNEAIGLLELKPEGRNLISVYDFINGYRPRPGEYFY